MGTRTSRIAHLTAAVVLAATSFSVAEQPAPVRTVQVQATCVRVPAGFSLRAGLIAEQPTPASGTAVLTPREAKMLAGLVEVVQDKDVITRPLVAVLDGQEGCVATGQSVEVVTGLRPAAGKANAYTLETTQMDVGVELRLVPKLSADGKYVHLTARATHSGLSAGGVNVPVTGAGEKGTARTVTFFPASAVPARNCNTVEVKVSLPDGGTAVVVRPDLSPESHGASEILWVLTATVKEPGSAK